MEKPLSYQARREVLQQVAPQYREAASSQKRALLDAFVATTGYHRTYARWLLNDAEEVQQTHGRSLFRTYGPDVQHALFLVWHAANRICTKRLIPFRFFQLVDSPLKREKVGALPHQNLPLQPVPARLTSKGGSHGERVQTCFFSSQSLAVPLRCNQ
ncbi:MAG TPA: hypothetical protein VF026_06890 [Ktedonobacteraceae bacterium]